MMNKKNLFSVTLLLCSSIGGQNLYGRTVEYSTNQKNNNNKMFEIKTLQSNLQKTIIEFTLHKVEVNEVNVENKKFTLVQLENASTLEEKGQPQVPQISFSIATPFNTESSIKVLSSEYKLENWGVLTPSKGDFTRNIDPESIPLTFGPIYSNKSRTENKFPNTDWKMKKSYQLRNTHGNTIVLFPFKYNGLTQQTQVTTKLVLQIDHNMTNRKLRPTMVIKSKGITPAYNQLYANHFINFSNKSQPTRGLNHSEHLLIIAHESYQKTLAPFVQWKNQMGITTEVILINSLNYSAITIKEMIQEYYNNNPELAFVLIIGDADQVPFYPGTDGNAYDEEADPMYGLLEGDDSYPDVVVARIPVNTTSELDQVLGKSISYEAKELSGNWPMSASGIASDQGWPSDKQRADQIRKLLMAHQYNTVDRLYDPTVQSTHIIKAINEGRGYINYTGHGSITAWMTGEFSNDEIDQLTNVGKWPMIISVACVNGKFSYEGGDSFAERWLKAGSLTQPTGAISVFASSTNQSWVPPTIGQAKIAELITSGASFTMGQLMTHGSIAVLDDNSDSAIQTFQTWHIFGDPTIRLRNTKAILGESIYKDQITIEKDDLDKRVITIAKPQEGDRITVTNEKGILANIIADGNILNIPVQEGATKLTISGENKLPYIINL